MQSVLVLGLLLVAFFGQGGLCFDSSSLRCRRFQHCEQRSFPLTALAETATSSADPESSVFQTLVENLVETIIASDKKRDTKGQDGASTGWTSWVDEAAAVKLSNAVASMCYTTKAKGNWNRWLLSSPSPSILEYSPFLMTQVDSYLETCNLVELDEMDGPTEESISFEAIRHRLGMRLFYLPSGETFQTKFQAPPGAMVYGLALHGGVKRFRCIGSNRRAGERTVIVSTKDDADEQSWMQYGGPERSYEAVDIGPCLFMEFLLYPDGLEVDLLNDGNSNDILVSSPMWEPHEFLSRRSSTIRPPQEKLPKEIIEDFDTARFKDQLQLSVGGLQSQIDQIVRRVVDGRAYQGSDRSDMAFLFALGLSPIRGLLLYGPPGCGKTHLAREISRNIDSRPPKIVSAPELLDRWVGSTERNVRELFQDAKEELYEKCGGDATKSKLHVIVIDEIDAVFRKRSSSDGTSEVTRASAVNQILARLDGVETLDNILLIGMTNRKDLLDPALLRPGRLEVKIEIPLPDKAGRREILQIQFGSLREAGKLSQTLCHAIDGVDAGRISIRKVIDLAGQTVGFSGADLAGLVRNAGSIALDRTRRQSLVGGIDGLVVTLEDVRQALQEVKSAALLPQL